jgi:hypothetical protein
VKEDFRRYLFFDYDKENLGLFELMDANDSLLEEIICARVLVAAHSSSVRSLTRV